MGKCPRCGKTGGGNGHATLGEFWDCVERTNTLSQVEQNLTRWSKDWQNMDGQIRLEVLYG